MVHNSPVIDKIESIIAPSLQAMDYALVQVRMLNTPGGKTLQVMAERNDNVPMTVEDCAQISDAISAILDVEDPISHAYDLEISSPGIDRPLVKLEDYTTYAGLEAKVEAEFPIEGRKRWRGIITGVSGKDVLIQLPDVKEVSVIPFADIAAAKLVMNDELMKRYLNKTEDVKQEE